MPEKTHKIAQEKKEVVKKIVKQIKDYPIIGIVNMENLPSAQLQKMKKQLRGKVELYMTKIKLTNLAINEAKKTKQGIDALQQYVKGMPALLFTKENPFSLYKILKKSKSPAAAKAGQNAPKDLVIPAGPTPFTPGPVISEFAALGIKAGVEGGKVAVKQDTTVCKEGNPISAPLASMLTRLGIEPMEIGLDLVAVFENGTIYTKKVLDIDEKVFEQQLTQAAAEAYNLAIETAYPTKETIELLLQKTFKESKAVALEANILADAVVAELIEKAEREMIALKTTANIQVDTSQKKTSTTATETNNSAQNQNTSKSNTENMIEEIKQHETKQKPSAEQIVKDVQKTTQKDNTKHEKTEINEVEALAKKLAQKGTLR